jgi:hypothetical protein
MKKYSFFLLAVLLSWTANVNALPHVFNISDKCSCFSKDMTSWHIDHCEKLSTPRLAGVFKDVKGTEVILLEPGKDIDSPKLDDPYDGGIVGIRSPGPSSEYKGGGWITYSLDYNKIVYAVPVYLLHPEFKFYDVGLVALAMLEESIVPGRYRFNAGTCTYTPGDHLLDPRNATAFPNDQNRIADKNIAIHPNKE